MRIIRAVYKWLREIWQGYPDENAATVTYMKSLIDRTNMDEFHWYISDEIETEHGVGFYFKVAERKDITFSIGYANVGLANPHTFYLDYMQIDASTLKDCTRLSNAIYIVGTLGYKKRH